MLSYLDFAEKLGILTPNYTTPYIATFIDHGVKRACRAGQARALASEPSFMPVELASHGRSQVHFVRYGVKP
jgi:hypothetical protein